MILEKEKTVMAREDRFEEIISMDPENIEIIGDIEPIDYDEKTVKTERIFWKTSYLSFEDYRKKATEKKFSVVIFKEDFFKNPIGVSIPEDLKPTDLSKGLQINFETLTTFEFIQFHLGHKKHPSNLKRNAVYVPLGGVLPGPVSEMYPVLLRENFDNGSVTKSLRLNRAVLDLSVCPTFGYRGYKKNFFFFGNIIVPYTKYFLVKIVE